ncbi:efflux RND transporter periplasmic adaptor subunit [Archangium gephyra]|uniref:HlyD family secretion protein n=1 Tax=Archangium gephyra TaxID=48 RepID=UPI0035D3FF2D
MTMRKRIKTWGLVVVGLVGVGLWSTLPGSGPEVVQAREEVLTAHLVARAMPVPREGVVEIPVWTNGRVRKVYVREGDRVKAGQVLAEVDTALDVELQRRAAETQAIAEEARAVTQGPRPEERAVLEAELSVARNELALAEDRLQRHEYLGKQGTVPQVTVVESRSAYQVARARLDAAEARLKQALRGGRPEEVRAARQRVTAMEAARRQARHEVEMARLVSPIDGVVLTRRIDPGDTLTSAQTGTQPPVFELADMSRFELRVEVEEADALRIQPGLSVSIRLPGGKESLGRGRIVRLNDKLEPRRIGAEEARIRAERPVRTVWVETSEREGTPPLLYAQQLEAWIELPGRRVEAAVPHDAIRVHEGKPVVEVPGLLGTREVPVALGAFDDERVEVLGVKAGTRVRRHQAPSPAGGRP